jgi:magnesium-protoporphyrin O-methyltransferase
MMTCCPHCQGAEERCFNQRTAESELRRYQRNGARRTTKRLLDALKSAGVTGMTLLDIGGGIGVIQHELNAAGVTDITDVDASRAYLRIAQQEAEQRGYTAQYVYGDFVTLADQIEAADIVTMDRVICCYPDGEALVNTAAARARRFFGVVYPRDNVWMRLAEPLINSIYRLRGNPFRIFVHPTATVERIVATNGLQKIAQHNGLLWQVVVYARRNGRADSPPLNVS